MVELVVLLIFSAILILAVLAVIFKPTRIPTYSVPIPGTYETAKFNQIQKAVLSRIARLQNHHKWLEPYNNTQLQSFKHATEQATKLSQLGVLSYILPNPDVAPIHELSDPLDTTCFVFEQGPVGWYWMYNTAQDTNGKWCNFIFYLIRMECGNKKVRKALDLKLGDTTVYFISAGMGTEVRKWVHTPFIITRGVFKAISKTQFSFSAEFEDGSCRFQSTETGKFNLDVKWGAYQLKSLLVSKGKPSFNARKGCAPCISGAGTNYWSYPHLVGEGTTLKFPNQTVFCEKGAGWLDRQWMNLLPASNLLKLISLRNRFKGTTKSGLGKYVWVSINTPNGQYMIMKTGLNQNVASFVGEEWDSMYIKYGQTDQTTYKNKCTLKILEITVVDNVKFPIRYQFSSSTNSAKTVLTVDGSKFGNTVTYDPSGNLHYSGGALVYDNEGKNIGTGLIEANQFQTVEDFNTKVFDTAGFSSHEAFKEGNKIPLWQYWPVITMINFGIVGIAGIVVGSILLKQEKK